MDSEDSTQMHTFAMLAWGEGSKTPYSQTPYSQTPYTQVVEGYLERLMDEDIVAIPKLRYVRGGRIWVSGTVVNESYSFPDKIRRVERSEYFVEWLGEEGVKQLDSLDVEPPYRMTQLIVFEKDKFESAMKDLSKRFKQLDYTFFEQEGKIEPPFFNYESFNR